MSNKLLPYHIEKRKGKIYKKNLLIVSIGNQCESRQILWNSKFRTRNLLNIIHVLNVYSVTQGRIGNEKVICHVMGLVAPYRKFQSQLQ